MSGLFQQVMHELGIKQFKLSTYHPESQGALERFHHTLKKHDQDVLSRHEIKPALGQEHKIMAMGNICQCNYNITF